MELSNIPGKLVLPFANAGGKNTIPTASQIGIVAGAASLTDGFPPLTRTPIAAGGVPPSGLDMNGILYEMSAIIRWANAGGGYPFDGTFATDTNVGGYPKGARILRTDGAGYWLNTTDGNVTDPESAGAAAAGWVPDFTSGVAAVTMTNANATLTPAQYGKPIIVISGLLTANLNLIFPNIAGQWTVINNCTGAFLVTAKTAAGTGSVLSNNADQIFGDGTNIYAANGFLQSGTGAIVRTMNDKAKETVSIKDFGASSGGSFDNGPAVRYSISSQIGAALVSSGTYSAGATGGYVANITRPVSLRGDGGTYTAINPNLAAATDDTIRVTPDPLYDFSNVMIEKLSLHDPSFGTRVGRYGVFVDTQIAGSNAALFKVRDVNFGQGSNYGFRHLNSAIDNVNGGLYAATLEGNSIKGGVYLENSGDSNNIVHNVISGENVGVNASLVPGASLLEIQANNITNTGGAIRLDAGSRFRIIGNNIENYAPGTVSQNNAAVVNIAGANGTMYGGVVQQNLISAFASSDATALLRVRNCRGTLVQDNVFLNGSSATVGIDIGDDCQDVRIGPNSFNAAVTTKVNDAGIGTMGVIKTPALQNGWTAFSAGQSTLKYIKSADGMVHVFGIIAGGTIAGGTLVATLAPGFRPSEIIRSPVMVVNAGTPQTAEMSVENDGSLRIGYVLANNQVNVNFSFPAADLANATSLE